MSRLGVLNGQRQGRIERERGRACRGRYLHGGDGKRSHEEMDVHE
jgi:hypothetical protein